MQNPCATVCVSNQHIYFRIDHVPPQLFYRYLHLIRKQIPNMHWDKNLRMWRLSMSDLKLLYEICRFMFGVEYVLFRYADYSSKQQVIQSRLPGLEEE